MPLEVQRRWGCLNVTNEQPSSWILPCGTAVVTLEELRGPDGGSLRPKGAVGVIAKAPSDAAGPYRVRFPDGVEASLGREQLTILKRMLRDDIDQPATNGSELRPYVIYCCIVGSRAFGLAEDESDIDRRGIYLPPANLHWSLAGMPAQLEFDETEEVYWEFEKFIRLALKANPNVLECLYTPLVEKATDLACELLAMRDAFLSQLVYQTYNGYVLSQFKKMQRSLDTHGQVKWKHAMHLIRLLLAGIAILREGRVPVSVGEHRDRLLAIRRGEMTFREVEGWRQSLQVEFERAFETTSLPERPDYEQANDLLIRARRSMVDWKEPST